MKHAVFTISGMILLSACTQLSESISDTLHPKDTVINKHNIIQTSHVSITTTIHKEAEKKIFSLTDSITLLQAEAALKALPQYAGKQLYIYSTIYFSEDAGIIAMLQHPENPKYVDRYSYRNGAWSAPEPVQLSVKDVPENMMIPLDKIHFIQVAGVARIYNEKAAQIEGAKPTREVYLTVWNHTIRWSPVNISGSRERYSIQFNPDGTLRSFKQE